MSWRPGIMPILDVILRVPPLFIMDSVLNGTFLLPWLKTSSNVVEQQDVNEAIESSDGYSPVTVFLLSFICFAVAILVFLLTTKQILDFYSYIFSGVVLWFSFWFNKNYVESELQLYSAHEEPLNIFRQNPGPTIANVFVQVAMAFCYNSFHIDSQQQSDYQRTNSDFLVELFRSLTYVCLLQPIIWRFLLLSPEWLQTLPSICVILVGMELVFIAIMHLRHLYFRAKLMVSTVRVLVRTYGFQFFVESQWIRLHVPNVLRVFWIIRTIYHVINLTVGTAYENMEASNNFTLNNTEVLDISRQALISGSETVLALLGMTSMISYITHYLGIAMATFVGSENEEDKTMGTVSAILFFILAQQTGLTGLHPDKRLQRLFRNFCLLSTAILHFIHSMVNVLLMNLSAGHNPNRWRHARPLFMCFLLISLPVTLMIHLWEQNTLSTWMLAVTAFSIEVIIKVLITLMLYGIFMYDTYRDPFWEKMDDYVYYIKSTGNTIEFLFGILLFCNGAWIMIFEHGGTIRACMMCIHAYFNIWVMAKQGWKVFINRRTAVKKIESLPEASKEQLEEHNDVCAICYQDLSSARVTRCNHLFHGVCLRKWLYLQDRCPLCHQLIYQDANAESDSAAQNNNNAAAVEHPENPENLNNHVANNVNNVNNERGAGPAATADLPDAPGGRIAGAAGAADPIDNEEGNGIADFEFNFPRYARNVNYTNNLGGNVPYDNSYQLQDPLGPHGGASADLTRENGRTNIANSDLSNLHQNEGFTGTSRSRHADSTLNQRHLSNLTSSSSSHRTFNDSNTTNSPTPHNHRLQNTNTEVNSDLNAVPNGRTTHQHPD